MSSSDKKRRLGNFDQDEFYIYLNSVSKNEFKLGVFDCFVFVSDYYKKRYNKSFFETEFKGKYKTRKGWKSLIKKKGYKNLKDIMDSEFIKKHSIHLASRGDLVLYKDESLGLCDGSYSIFLSEDDPNYVFNHIETHQCDGAWSL